MRRRIALFSVLVAAVVAVLGTAAWFVLVSQTERAINQWADAQRAEGVDATWQNMRFGGFPLRIDTQIDKPQMIVHQPDRTTVWRPPALTLIFSSIAPRAISFESPGSHDLQFTSGDTAWSAVMAAQDFAGKLVFPSSGYNRIEGLSGQFADLQVAPDAWTEVIAIGKGHFEAIHRPTVQPDPQAVHLRSASLAVDLAAHDIRLPDRLLTANLMKTVGGSITAFSTQVQVNGELDPGSVDADSLAIWRDAGGTVDVTSIELRWGALLVTAGGTLALDDNLQPAGSFSTQIAGLDQLVTAMERDGVLSPNDAAIARITLAVLTRASDDGGPNRAEIPITLQERVLRLGPIALIEFPPVVWE